MRVQTILKCTATESCICVLQCVIIIYEELVAKVSAFYSFATLIP